MIGQTVRTLKLDQGWSLDLLALLSMVWFSFAFYVGSFNSLTKNGWLTLAY